MAIKIGKSKNFAKFEKMSDAAMAKYFDKQKPFYRRALAKLTSLLKLFFGRVFQAFASDEVIEVSGGAGAGKGKGKGGTSGSLTVEKFKAPGKRALKGYIDALETIGFIEDLAYQQDRAAASEDKNLRKQLPEITKLRDAMIDAYTAAMDAMESVAQKHIPDAVGSIFHGAQETARKLLPEDKELFNYVYVGVEGEEADFVLNIDLTEDEENKSLIAVTARLIPQNDHFEIRCYINHLDKMALPGRYNLGTAIEGKDVKDIVKKMKPAIEHEISMTHVIGLLGAIAFPIDETEIEQKISSIDGVSGVSFDSEDEGIVAIHFEIPGIATGDEVAKSARAAAFRVIRSSSKVKRMVERERYSLSLTGDDDSDTCTVTLVHKN